MMVESYGLGETCGFLSLEKPHVLFLSTLINRHSQAVQRNTPDHFQHQPESFTTCSLSV